MPQQNNSAEQPSNPSRRQFLKDFTKALFVGTGVAVLGTDVLASDKKKIENDQEVRKMENPRLSKMPDHNMPDGFERKHVYSEIKGKKTNIASVFYFEKGKAHAYFISNDNHPECFPNKVNYQKVEEVLQKDNKELVVAFAGAYRSLSGNIEGKAFEKGKFVGEDKYSKWHGFVYITKNGDIEMHRMKDLQGNFDQKKADDLIARVVSEKGSVYQQIPAIWNGVQKFEPSKTGLYEMRAICESKDGKKFVINCTEKITQDEFLKMCLNLKDETGNPAVYNLMLTDTGECSLGVFRDKNQIESDKKNHSFTNMPMVDESWEQKGFTNIVALTN